MKEDKLIPKLIDLDKPAELESDVKHDVDLEVEIESHYNHYGSRGVVDLATRLTGKSDFRVTPTVRVYEIKSTHAVKQATGANEILRQFNKHRKYYFEDDSNDCGAENTFELVFIPTKTTVKHVYDNYEVYLAAQKQMPKTHSAEGHQARILFRSPLADNHPPANAITGSEHSPGIDEPQEYIEEAAKIDSGAADHVADILKELGLAKR